MRLRKTGVGEGALEARRLVRDELAVAAVKRVVGELLAVERDLDQELLDGHLWGRAPGLGLGLGLGCTWERSKAGAVWGAGRGAQGSLDAAFVLKVGPIEQVRPDEALVLRAAREVAPEDYDGRVAWLRDGDRGRSRGRGRG